MQPNISNDPMLDVAPYTANLVDLDWNRRPNHKAYCSVKNSFVALGKIKCSNGKYQYKAYCLECGGKGSPFPLNQIEGLDETRIPLITEHEVIPCERCGSKNGSERHHWAPRHLFKDADDWPTSHLCPDCHNEWHAKVTPNMRSKNVTLRKASA